MSGPAAGLESKNRNLLLRIAAAAILAPLVMALAYAGGVLWAALATLVALGLLFEWTAVVGAPVIQALPGYLGLLLAGICCGFGRFDLAVLSILSAAALAATVSPGRRGWVACGVVYAGVLLLTAVMLRRDEAYGFIAILFVLLLVWATDSGGYFVGRALGGPKLWPRVSPNKTWAGALGGFAAALLAASLVAAAQSLRMFPLLGVAAILSAAAQGGDLLESAVKRRFGVKDSGRLIPGHGGLLDRLDSLVTAMLVAALIGVARAGSDSAARGLMLW